MLYDSQFSRSGQEEVFCGFILFRKGQIRGAKTSAEIWPEGKSRVVSWLCSTGRSSYSGVSTASVPHFHPLTVVDSLPPSICFLPLLIASFDPYDSVRLRAETRVASLTSNVDFNHLWTSSRILHLLSSTPLSINSTDPPLSRAMTEILTFSSMPSQVSQSSSLPFKLNEKLFRILKKCPVILGASSSNTCHSGIVLSSWAVEISLEALQKSPVYQIDALDLLSLITRSITLRRQTDSLASVYEAVSNRLDVLIPSVISIISATLQLTDMEVISSRSRIRYSIRDVLFCYALLFGSQRPCFRQLVD